MYERLQDIPVRKPAPKAPVPFVDPEKLPRLYRARVVGNCLEPIIANGAILSFDKQAAFGPLSIVAIFLTPATMKVAAWGTQRIIKRMLVPFPAGTRMGPRGSRSRRAPKMVVEQINPYQRYEFTPSEVFGVHACVAVAAEIGANEWHATAADYALEGRRHAALNEIDDGRFPGVVAQHSIARLGIKLAEEVLRIAGAESAA